MGQVNETVDVLAVMARKRAPFRDAGMRKVYDACVEAYRTRGSLGDGNSGATMFARGFNGNHAGSWDAASRKTFSYAQFRAGQDCAKDEARAAVAELISAAAAVEKLATLHEGDDRMFDRLHAALARCGVAP